MKKSYLIIGAGLAGLTLAYQLKKRGQQVLLLDKGENHSSSIAAGIVNPMVFRRMNKSWRLDDFLPFSETFYKELESLLEVSFYHPIPILRCFSSLQEKQWWLEKSAKREYEDYLHDFQDGNTEHPLLHCEFGMGKVKSAYWIDTSVFVENFQKFFLTNNELRQQEFHSGDLFPAEARYEDKIYDGIIFCAGHAQKYLPYFHHLPIEQTKGHVMTIRTNELSETESLNRKCFVLPLGEKLFKVGATYEWNNPTLHATPDGLHDLQDKLSHLFKGSYELIKQDAGIRPTVKDRRPLLGQSDEYKHLYLFNGLGAKGYMMAPLLSLEMAELILDGKEPPMEYNIKRFS